MLRIEKKDASEEKRRCHATHRQKSTFILCVWARLKKKRKKQNRKKQQQNNVAVDATVEQLAAAAMDGDESLSNVPLTPELICHRCRLIQSSAAWLDVAVA